MASDFAERLIRALIDDLVRNGGCVLYRVADQTWIKMPNGDICIFTHKMPEIKRKGADLDFFWDKDDGDNANTLKVIWEE